MRESFIFYKSFSEAIKQLPETEQLKALWAIINHSVEEQEQHVEGLANIVYTMAKPQIEANKKRCDDGLKGGRPLKKTTGYKKEKPNVNVNNNVNENVNANGNVNCNSNAITENDDVVTTIFTPNTQISFTEKQIEELEQLYPDVDILKDFEKMQDEIDNMAKCNLSGKSLESFITRWLDRTQMSGGNKHKYKPKPKNENSSPGKLTPYDIAIAHTLKKFKSG